MDLIPFVEETEVLFKLLVSTIQGDATIKPDPVEIILFNAGKDLSDCFAKKLLLTETGKLPESLVRIQKAIVNRNSIVIQNYFMMSESKRSIPDDVKIEICALPNLHTTV